MSLAQGLNALLPILLTFLERTMVSKDEQFTNAVSSIWVTPLGRTNDFIDAHDANELSPMTLRLFGRVNDVRFGQFSKAFLPMLVKPSLKSTVASEEHPQKVDSSRKVIGPGIFAL